MSILPHKKSILYSKNNQFNLHAKFSYTKVISVGTFTYLGVFKKIIGFSTLLKKGVACVKGNNSTFKAGEIMEYLIEESLSELRGDNKSLLSLKSNIEKIREVCLIFDDTVITMRDLW